MPKRSLKRHNLLVLCSGDIVNFLDILVGKLLNRLFGRLLLILGHLALLLHVLALVNSLSADISDCDLRILSEL